MKRRELSDDIIEAIESTPSEVADLLGRFNVNEYWEKSFHMGNNPNDTSRMVGYVEKLKKAGLDIGKGDSQFGYKMPLPDKDTSMRYLHIFRRK